MNNKLNMNELGEIIGFLGLRINKRAEGDYITQTTYVENVLERFRMTAEKHKGIPPFSGDDSKKFVFPSE